MLKIDNEFLKLNENLVYSIVNKYASSYNKEDLYQVGMMAIIRASEMYDSNKGVKFSTFAYKYILGEILKYIREDKSIKPSRDIIKNYIKLKKFKEDIYISSGYTASIEELEEMINMPRKKIYEIENYCRNIESLDSVINNGDKDITLMDTIESKENISKEDLICLKDELLKLNSEERNFIYQRYFENKTQTQIAKEYNTNQVKIYRYERTILDKLKNGLE